MTHQEAVSRRRLLMGGAAAAAGAAAGRLLTPGEARASESAPVSLGAICTIKDSDAGTLVFQVRTDAPANVRIRSDAVSEAARFSPWVGTLSTTEPSKPNTHEAEIAFPAAALPGVPGGHTFQVEVAPPGRTAPTLVDPARYTVEERPRKGASSAFTVAVGSCIDVLFPSLAEFDLNDHTNDVSIPALQRVTDPACYGPFGLPKAYFHLGDFGYPDASGQVAQQYWDDFVARKIGYRSALQWVKGHADFRQVATRMPVFVLPDDHDYGQDGAYRGPSTEPAVPPGYIPGKGPYAVYAAVAFQDVLPMYPFAGQLTQPPNRVISIGEVDFFLLDNRKLSDPQGIDPTYWENHQWYSLLGSIQRDWLKNSLRASVAKIKVVLAPQTFHFYWSGGERKDVLNWVANNGVTGRILLMTGDKHCQGHFEWRTAAGPKVDEIMCSPIRNNSPSPISSAQIGRDDDYTFGLDPAWAFTRLFPTGDTAPLSPAPVSQVAAFIDLDTAGDTEVVTVRMVKGDGSLLYRRTLT